MRNIFTIGIFIFSLSLFSQKKYLPPNEEIKDQSLVLFLKNLNNIIAAKDQSKLLSIVHDSIVLGYDDYNGKQNFIESFDWESGEVWNIFESILKFKGDFQIEDYNNYAKSKSTYIIPYIHNYNMSEDEDPYGTYFIMGTNVNVRKDPNLKAEVLGQLSHEVVFVSLEDDSSYVDDWTKIATKDGSLKGWVFNEFIYAALSYRLILEKENQQWKIKAMIAGD